MSNTILRNENVSVTLKSLGGELTSIKDASGTEYLWQGNPDFWSGQAPVLFPIVGCLRNGTATIGDSKTCSFGRHGLARKLEFTLVSSSETCAVYSLKADDSTKEQYPYDFELQMIYELTNHGVKVSHKVINHGDIVMPYCIGGHPAFNCPLKAEEKQSDYQLSFDTDKTLVCSILRENGLLTARKKEFELTNHKMRIVEDLFDEDALIIEGNQAKRVGLVNPQGETYLEVEFDAPLFGIWSPAKKSAPFVCIEPWYGRSDKEDFSKKLEEREWGNELKAGEIFEKSYQIRVK